MASEARQLVILGVGNRLRGDDAIGCIVCDELLGAAEPAGTDSPPRHQDTEKPFADSALVPRPSSLIPPLFVLDAGNTPENFLQPIADRKPTRILIVDCCNFGGEPGEFRLFSREEIEQLSYGLLSTHTLPLNLAVGMLALETMATIELLGIQPEQLEFNTELSAPLRAALPALVQFIRDWARS